LVAEVRLNERVKVFSSGPQCRETKEVFLSVRQLPERVTFVDSELGTGTLRTARFDSFLSSLYCTVALKSPVSIIQGVPCSGKRKNGAGVGAGGTVVVGGAGVDVVVSGAGVVVVVVVVVVVSGVVVVVLPVVVGVVLPAVVVTTS